MRRFRARSLLDFTTEQLWHMLDGEFILVFDDGKELHTEWRGTIYSSYGWDFHRAYPFTPLLIEHHVQSILSGKRLSAGTHLELLGRCCWAAHDAYVKRGDAVDIDPLAKQIYVATNTMYNDLNNKVEDCVTSMNIEDFMEVLEHPEVVEAKLHMKPTQDSIDHVHGVLTDVLLNRPEMQYNRLAQVLRSNLASHGQVMQCLGPRGYVTDTDSTLFRHPVMSGYAEGLRLLHDSFIESRSAAKSSEFAKAPLQAAEYFSRRLQLMIQTVQNLHPGDCQTTKYTVWRVRGREYDNDTGELLTNGDLQRLVGKYYLDEETNTLKAIQKQDKHLVGKTLKIRTTIHCAHPDPYGVCSVCFGELSATVPAKTNIGNMCATNMAQQTSQSVLSVKHLDGRSVVDWIALDSFERNFFKIHNDGSSYLFAETARKRNPKLIIFAEDAKNITDIEMVDNVRDLNITRVTEMECVGICLDGDTEDDKLMTELNVNVSRRLASLTHAALDHIKKNGYTVDEKGNYWIDMTGYNWDEPVMTLPLKHFNMSDHSKEIAAMLESNSTQIKHRDKNVSPDAFLVELCDLVNSKLDVPVAILDVILKGIMIVSAENDDYRLPKPWTTAGIGVLEKTMNNRSLGAAMAYENHLEIIQSPASYLKTTRVSHPMDIILMPSMLNARYQTPPTPRLRKLPA